MSYFNRLIGFLTIVISFLLVFGFVSEVSADFTPPSEITVEMYQLLGTGTIRPPGIPCNFGGDEYGCVPETGEVAFTYPYTSSVVTVSVEQDYLLDVVPQEMSADGFPLAALKAQAAAARSYAYYQNLFPNPNVPFNNSNQYQVFIPKRFESIGNPSVIGNSPCDTFFLSQAQHKICRAVGQLGFMLYSYEQAGDPPFDPRPVFAEFGGDLLRSQFSQDSAPIVDPDGNVLYPYQHPFLREVYDPISTNPVVPGGGLNFHGRGMAQNGAGRWALGNRAFPTGIAPWNVKLNADEILTHYYTGVDFFELNSAGQVTPTRKTQPDQRWLALQIDWSATVDGQFPRLEPNTGYALTLVVQNVGVAAWQCNQPITEYRLRYAWTNRDLTLAGADSAELCNLSKGDTLTTTLTIVTPNLDDNFSIAFDIHNIYLPTSTTIDKFSDPDQLGNSWQGFKALAQIGNPTEGNSYLPTVTASAARGFVVPTAVEIQTVKVDYRLSNLAGLIGILFISLSIGSGLVGVKTYRPIGASLHC